MSDDFYTIPGKKTAEWRYTLEADGTETLIDLTPKVQCGDCGRLVDISIECAPGTQWRCYDCGWGSK